MAVLAVLLIFLLYVRNKMITAEYSLREVARQEMAENFSQSLYHIFLPSFAMMQEEQSGGSRLLERQFTEMMPLYGYTLKQYESDLWEELLHGESEETYYLLEEEQLVGISNTEMENTEIENTGIENSEVKNTERENVAINDTAREGTAVEEIGKELQEEKIRAMLAENQVIAERNHQTTLQGEVESSGVAEAVQNNQLFIPHTLQNQVDLVRLNDYETLVQDFYTIDKNTMAGSDQLNLEKLLGQDCSISKDSEEPQILIYHTHSQEGFADSIPGEAATTIVGVGDKLAKILQETYGYMVLHHTGQYDVEDRDDAYSKSLPAIEQVLQENPSIQVIIDLHRDQMAEETKLVMDLDGRPTARFMFFNGLSRTRKTGNISYLYNENQDANLAFSFQMQLKATEYYPGLTRKIYLKGYRYNMHLRPRTLLVELGAQNNTLEEAMNACDPLAHILDMVLSGQ